MRTGERICWAVAILGVPALIATHSVAKRLQYEEPVKAASYKFSFVPVANDGSNCPTLTESKRLLSMQDVGSISISSSANTCGGETVSGTFQERQIALAHNGANAGLETGDAPIQDGASMGSVETTATFDSSFGVVDCCATRSGNTLSLGANCNGSDPTLQRFCVYKASF